MNYNVKLYLKRLITLHGLVLVLLLVGCSKSTIEPTYTNDQTMHIGAWVSPSNLKDEFGNYLYITEEHYQSIADSGINVIYGLTETPEDTLVALDMAEKAGIEYYVRSWEVQNLFSGVIDANGNVYEQEVENDFEKFKELVEPYKDHPAFKGHLIFDEPSANEYQRLAIFNELYKEYLPDKDFYTNLLPTYSSLGQRGGRTYEEYISEYLDVLDPSFISYDHYPLMVFYEQPELTTDYLLNLEIVAELSHAADVPFWLFIQTIGYSTISGTQTRRPAEEDIRWQVAVSMAYGARGLQHFTYWTPGANGNESFTDAMIDRDGNKTDLYHAAQKVNNEVLSYDHVYLDFNWQGTMTVLADENKPNQLFNMLGTNLDGHKRINSVKSEEDLIIGTFKDSSNNDGFMIVNFADPALGKSNEVTVDFKNAEKAIVYQLGVKNIVDLNKGKLSLDLEHGEGVFVIPY